MRLIRQTFQLRRAIQELQKTGEAEALTGTDQKINRLMGVDEWSD